MTPTPTLSILNFLCSSYSVVRSFDWTLANTCHWDGVASNLPSQTTSQHWGSSGTSHQASSLSIPPHRCPHPVSWLEMPSICHYLLSLCLQPRPPVHYRLVFTGCSDISICILNGHLKLNMSQNKLLIFFLPLCAAPSILMASAFSCLSKNKLKIN